MFSQRFSKSLLLKGEKVADRPDEGVVRCFCRLDILNGVAPPPPNQSSHLRLTEYANALAYADGLAFLE